MQNRSLFIAESRIEKAASTPVEPAILKPPKIEEPPLTPEEEEERRYQISDAITASADKHFKAMRKKLERRLMKESKNLNK
jgi:hypothetical protein